MATLVDANDAERPVPYPPTVLYIPNFLDVLVEEAEDNLTFHRWVFAYWMPKGEDEELTMEDARALASPSRTSANDVINMADPIIRVNIDNMLRKMIMQDSTSWKAIRFLESLQQTI
jgi:hypothetical protein